MQPFIDPHNDNCPPYIIDYTRGMFLFAAIFGVVFFLTSFLQFQKLITLGSKRRELSNMVLLTDIALVCCPMMLLPSWFPDSLAVKLIASYCRSMWVVANVMLSLLQIVFIAQKVSRKYHTFPTFYSSFLGLPTTDYPTTPRHDAPSVTNNS